jgi:hypothetical protein
MLLDARRRLSLVGFPETGAQIYNAAMLGDCRHAIRLRHGIPVPSLSEVSYIKQCKETAREYGEKFSMGMTNTFEACKEVCLHKRAVATHMSMLDGGVAKPLAAPAADDKDVALLRIGGRF